MTYTDRIMPGISPNAWSKQTGPENWQGWLGEWGGSWTNVPLQVAPQYQPNTLASPASVTCIDKAHGLSHENMAQQRKHFWVNTGNSCKPLCSSFGKERETLWKFPAHVLRGRMAVLDKALCAGWAGGWLQAVPAFKVGEQRGTGVAGLLGRAHEGEKQAVDISAMDYDRRNLKKRLRWENRLILGSSTRFMCF